MTINAELALVNRWILGLSLGLALTLTTIASSLTNGGFENGDLTGWTVTARDVTRYGMGGAASPPLPAEGSYFALLRSDVSPWTELSQQVTMGVGDSLSGFAYYNRWIVPDYQAYVRIFDSSNTLVQEPWYKSSTGSTAWETWTFTATAADTYKLVLGLREPSLGTMHTEVFFDGVTYTAIPEPATLSLLLLGGWGLLRRRHH